MGEEIRLSWRRGWRIALRSIPLHGDPAAVRGTGRLYLGGGGDGGREIVEGDAQQGQSLGRRDLCRSLQTMTILVQSLPLLLQELR